MADQWTVAPDGKSATVTGRTPVPLSKKLNPIWWFGNDNQPAPPDDYMAGKPQWLRMAAWYARNPLQNFGSYVVGVADQNYTVHGPADTILTTLDDASPPQQGWLTKTIKLPNRTLPFISYSGWCLFYAGWQPDGFFGFKFNIKNSPFQLW